MLWYYDTCLKTQHQLWGSLLLGARSAFFPIISQSNPLHFHNPRGTQGTVPHWTQPQMGLTNRGLCLTNRGPCGSSSSWSSSLPWNSQPWLFYPLHMFQGAYSYLHALFFCPSCNLTAKWRYCLVVFAIFPISLLSQRINHLWSIITSIFCCLCLYHNSSVRFSTVWCYYVLPYVCYTSALLQIKM